MNKLSKDHLLDDEWLDDIDFASLVKIPDLKEPPPQPNPIGDKYVIFHLDDKIYGINSKNVAEVTGSLPVTPLPGVPEWVSGIASLRGDLISVIDLRKLWKKDTTPPQKTRLIVFHPGKNDSPVAFIVDKLSEIVTLTDKEIKFSAEDFTDSFPTIFGRSDFRSQPLFLLDINKILTSLNIRDSKSV